MNKLHYDFAYEVYNDIEELQPQDRQLLENARQTTSNAYVPYSNFQVGASAILANGQIMSGTNQENASFPVTLCAERVLLSAISSVYPNVAVITMAISYNNLNGTSDKPISPCGMCRQAIGEYEDRFNQPVRLILSGLKGKIYIIEKASHLLPLAFTASDLT